MDTAGAEDYYTLREAWMRNRDGLIYVYAINDKSSIDELEKFYSSYFQLFPNKDIPIIFAANKIDLEDIENGVLR